MPATASSILRFTQAPRDADTPKANAGVGRATRRPARWRPELLSRNRGSDNAPADTEPVHSNLPFTPCAWTPVSHRLVLTIGSPGAASVLPMGKFDNHPRPRIRNRSSLVAGNASDRNDSRY